MPFAEWQAVVDANLTAAFLCTQAAFRVMKEQYPAAAGSSTTGRCRPPRPGRAQRPNRDEASITGLTKATSLDGRGYDIACGQIDIGNAATDLTASISAGALQPDGSTRPEPGIDAGRVANAVVQMASLPLEANIQFITLMATKMPFIGRG